MPDELRVAICSDLHIGENAREYDLQPGGTPLFTGQIGYVDYFRKCVKDATESADILIVSGDITDKAQPTQFEHAMTVVAQLAEILGVERECVFFVPGNHDLNWDVAQLAAEKEQPFWQQFRFAPFVHSVSAFDGTSHRASSLAEPPHFFVHQGPRADVWCFNSAAYDLPGTKPHHGRIREADRQQLIAELERVYASGPKDKYRLFVTHHHPRPQPDLYKDEPDFSGMVNGESLMEVLTRFQFDVIFHGHKHKPWCRSESVGGQNPIAIWCSGSFSLKLGSNYEGSVANVWHLMKLHGLSTAENAFGIVKSWAFAPGQGWLPSRPIYHAVDHLVPFGKIADRASIKNLMRNAIEAALTSEPIVSWETICSSEDDLLKYQTGVTVWSILNELIAEMGIRPYGDQDSLDRLFLSKERNAA